MAQVKPNIVCLGGGIGTVNLLKGLRNHHCNVTVVVSMADDGGSAGRLRRLYSVPPPGDLINCIAAMSDADTLLRDLLTFRFSGNRYGGDWALSGHKMGNLMLVALTSLTGDFYKAVSFMEDLFKTKGEILPATAENVSIRAITTDGITVEGEQNIDLGKYNGKRSLEKVLLNPKNAKATKKVLEAMKKADIIVAGPGDLYTTILPVLLVRDISKVLKNAKAKKVFVVNVANKPFETPNYNVSDYINAILKHCGDTIFDQFLVNTNFTPKIPRKYKYDYVSIDIDPRLKNGVMKQADFVDESFPIYHDSEKLASYIIKNT